MLCLHLSFYQGKQLLRSSYLTLVHSSSVYTGSNNSSWSFNSRARYIINVMKFELGRGSHRSRTGANWGAIIFIGRTSFHNIAAKIQLLYHTQSMHGYMRRNVDTLYMQHPPWWQNISTMITQQRTELCLEKVVNTENEKYNAFFYVTDCSS